MKKQIPHISAFPVGEPLPEQFSQYFIGQAYLAPLTNNASLHCPVHNVTFEPGCRNNWHSHTGGQLLICVGGKGFYQEKGKPARCLTVGDVVEIPANAVHWHGAAPDSWFSHLAIATNVQTNENTWLEPVEDAEYTAATSSAEAQDEWTITDPEFSTLFTNFQSKEVASHGSLDAHTRLMVIMASTIAQNTFGEFREVLSEAYANGVTPIELKEIIYQAAPYTGIARVKEALRITNLFLTDKGIKLPLEPQGTTTPGTRMSVGLAQQKAIFGADIDKMYEQSPQNQLHFQHYLSANCFGDYYTRKGLTVPQRELLTFAMLISLGGCEPQVKGHIRGNVAVGNDKAILIDVVTQLLPLNGYPRTLNALRCLNEMIPEK